MTLYPKSKTVPWAHQKDAWSFCHNMDSAYLNADMGTGKTKMAIDFANGWDVKRMLVICPKSVREVWRNQFALHSYNNFNIMIPDKGSAKRKAKEIIEQINLSEAKNEPLCIVLNYETFWRSPLGPTYNKHNRIQKIGELNKINWDLFVLDEAHRIMTPSGRASWGAVRFRKITKKRLWLSGTAFPSGPQNIYAQFRALDPSIFGTNYARFRARYCIMGGFENRQIIGYNNLDELNQRFYSKAFRVTKHDVLDLPPTMHEYRKCNLSQKAQRIYNEFEQELIAEIDNKEISANNALVKLLRLQQMAGGHIHLDDGSRIEIDPDNRTKLEVLKEILDGISKDSRDLSIEPVVIFTRFRPEMKQIKNLLKNIGRNPAELSGDLNQLAEWQNGKYDSIVVQIQTGKEGVDFTRACYAVYYSKNFSLGDYEQSLARLDRPGQTRPVTYYHIVCRNTVDIKLHAALRNKKNVVEEVLRTIRQ